MKCRARIGLICVVLLPLCDAAATFMTPRHASLVGEATKQQKEMPKTKHDKKPGSGYQKGSPLFEKQEERKKAGKVAPPPPPKPAGPPVKPPAGVPEAPPFPVVDPRKPEAWCSKPYCLSWKGFEYFLSYLIAWLLLALLWLKCPFRCLGSRSEKGYQERPVVPGQEHFTYGLFDLDHCGFKGGDHHVNICLCATCCTPIRIADTWSKQPFAVLSKNIFVSLIVVCTLIGLGPFTGNLSVLLFLCLAVYFRQQMRKQYNIQSGTAKTYCLDCLTWLCCSCCAVVQEARQSEFTCKADDKSPDLNDYH